MTHPDPNIPQAPPLTLYYQGKPVRVLLHHGHCCLLADDILALSPPRLRHQLQQQLAEYPGCALTLPQHDSPQCGWPAPALQRALQQSKRPAARQLQHWLQQQVLPALQQLPPDAPRWEQALAMAAEAGQQISHAVLKAVLEHGSDWQHSHWLLTLNYTASHPRRHAHGRLVALNSSATSLQALAQHIAGPDGSTSRNGELLRLAAACHQQLAKRTEKQAWRTEAAEPPRAKPAA